MDEIIIEHEIEPSVLVQSLFKPVSLRGFGSNCAVLTSEKQAYWNHRAWTIQWQRYTHQQRKDFIEHLPEWIGLYTSGTTGEEILWVRHRDQLMQETLLLSQLFQIQHIDKVITFAPINHIYGLLCSFFLPLENGVPVWYQPMNDFSSSWNSQPLIHPLFITIPSALFYLTHFSEQSLDIQNLTIVYSTAVLPESGKTLYQRWHDKLSFIELFGSTETGLVAFRMSGNEQGVWCLAPDVSFAKSVSLYCENKLDICSPRLACNTWREQKESCVLDDIVYVHENRQFQFIGRSAHMIKVNGLRINLDEIEQLLRKIIPCQDLACFATSNAVRAEHFDLVIVLSPHAPLNLQDLQELCQKGIGHIALPRKILVVPSIERGNVGKISYRQERDS